MVHPPWQMTRKHTAILISCWSLFDARNIRYATDIPMNGQTVSNHVCAPYSVSWQALFQISMLIDTGSTDAYVAGTIPGAIDTSQKSSITFASGPVFGGSWILPHTAPRLSLVSQAKSKLLQWCVYLVNMINHNNSPAILGFRQHNYSDSGVLWALSSEFFRDELTLYL